MKFISKEQEAVVKYRIKAGYEAKMQDNGFWFLVKGSHRMIIDGLGYDTFVRIQ